MTPAEDVVDRVRLTGTAVVPGPLLSVRPVPRALPAGVDLGAAVVRSTPALVCVVATDGGILLLNPALEQATGWALDDVVGRPFWRVLVVPEEAQLAEDCIARAVLTGVAPSQEGDWLDRWGGRRRVSMTISVVRDGDGAVVAVAFLGIDVTADRRAEARLRTQAARDALTGLANRDTLLRAMQEELGDETSVGCAVLFADLDGFKAANDTHGHQVGDMLLRAVGERLLAIAPAADVVARYGGDEFVVLCRDTDARGAEQVRSAIEAAVAVPFTTSHGLVHIGLSVGVAVGRHGDTATDLISAADRHMYGVKTSRHDRRVQARRG